MQLPIKNYTGSSVTSNLIQSPQKMTLLLMEESPSLLLLCLESRWVLPNIIVVSNEATKNQKYWNSVLLVSLHSHITDPEWHRDFVKAWKCNFFTESRGHIVIMRNSIQFQSKYAINNYYRNWPIIQSRNHSNSLTFLPPPIKPKRTIIYSYNLKAIKLTKKMIIVIKKTKL